jgi:DNA-binding response OmpR family regulator
MEPKKPAKKNTILVVDDDPSNIALLFITLGKDNYNLLSANSGEAAIEQAESALPDLILLDVMMSGIDGFETCKILKQNEKTKDIPVIIMTTLAEAESKVKGFKLGAIDYLTKPFNYEEVILRVQNHLLIHELKNSLLKKNEELEESLQNEKKLVTELQAAVKDIKTLTGLLPICAWCKNVRDDQGYWKQIETYFSERSALEFTHGICSGCKEKLIASEK